MEMNFQGLRTTSNVWGQSGARAMRICVFFISVGTPSLLLSQLWPKTTNPSNSPKKLFQQTVEPIVSTQEIILEQLTNSLIVQP